MIKTVCFTISLLLSATIAANALELGDPDSESAPVSEPEIDIPALNDNDNNPDDHADDANNVDVDEAVPGEHMVPKQTSAAATVEEDKWQPMKFARLQGLNKVTAKSSELKTDLGIVTKFGNLELKIEKCLRGPENEKVENTALFTIWDTIPGQEKKQVFHGWMFSSSPAISALEHPIYDIILLGCGEAPKVTVVAPAEKKKTAAKKPTKKKAEKAAE